MVESQCIPIEDSAPANLPLSGIWLRNQYIPYLETVDGRSDYIVPYEGRGAFSLGAGDAAVSPDGQYLAYIDNYLDPAANYRPQKRILRIIRSSGRAIYMDYWKQDWQWIVGWIDSQQLLLRIGHDRLVALNPFTGEWKPFQLPGWLISPDQPGGGLGFDMLDSRALYGPGFRQVMLRTGMGSYELRDMQTGLKIWSMRGYLGLEKASWSKDGSAVAFLLDDDAAIDILEDNNLVAALDLKTLLPDQEYPSGLSLSPDGQKLVFASADSSDSRRSHLMLFDKEQGTLSRLCLDDILVGYGGPSWSPDGRFIVSPAYYWGYQKDFDILVDTSQLRAFKLVSGQQQHRLLWLAAP